MLLGDDDLDLVRGKTTLVGGGFDPLHEGHIAYFGAAAAFGLPVVCSVDPDDYVQRKHPVLLERSRRLTVLDALKPIAFVYASPGSTAGALAVLRPKIFVKGSDWRGRLPAAELAACEALGIEIRYVDVTLNSSTGLIQALLDRASGA